MCLGVPRLVVAIVDEARDIVRVDVAGTPRNVSIALLRGADRPAPGDWVLVYAGLATQRLEEAEAREAIEMLDGFGQEVARLQHENQVEAVG